MTLTDTTSESVSVKVKLPRDFIDTKMYVLTVSQTCYLVGRPLLLGTRSSFLNLPDSGLIARLFGPVSIPIKIKNKKKRSSRKIQATEAI